MGKRKTTAQGLKADFIEQASPLVEQYIRATFGEEQLQSTDPHCRKEVWGLLKEFLLKADEKVFLEEKYRDGPEGTLLAIQEGIITLEEGERILQLQLIIKQIETAGGNIVNNGFIPSLTINTLPPKPDPVEIEHKEDKKNG